MAKPSTGHIPTVVQWDQAAILSAITQVTSGLSQLTNLTGNPTSDSKGTVTRNVRDYEIISALQANTEVLGRIQKQLSFITEVDLGLGEGQ